MDFKSCIILLIRSIDVILFSITPLLKNYISNCCISVTNYGRNSLRGRISWLTVLQVSGLSSLTLCTWPEHHSGGPHVGGEIYLRNVDRKQGMGPEVGRKTRYAQGLPPVTFFLCLGRTYSSL